MAQAESKQKPAEAQKGGVPDRTSESFGDWAVVCATPQNGKGERVCEVDATLTQRNQSTPMAQITFTRQAKDKPVRLIALVPVNVAIKPGVKIEAEPSKTTFDLPFTSCVPAACIAELELTKEQLQTLRAQTQGGQITVADSQGKLAALQFSFHGLDQALDAFFKKQEK